MIAKRVLVMGGLVTALAVPAGAAVAAAATSPPGPAPATTQPSQPGPGPGPGLGYGPMMGGSGGSRGCPYYNSPEMQQWRNQRQKLSPAERQKLMQQHRARMWAQRTGATSS